MKTFAVLLLSALSCSVAQAQRVDLEFLGLGKSYVIRFAEDQPAFRHTHITWNDDRTRGTNQKFTLEVFKVVQLSSGSWAQLEYPANPADYGKWNAKLEAQATLTDANIATFEKTAEGKENLKSLRESADRTISTQQSWINLAHAIEISDVPMLLSFRLEVETSAAKPDARFPFGLSPDEPKRELLDSPVPDPAVPKSYPSPDASESRLPTTGVEEATEEEPTAATTPKASTDRLGAELEELKAQRHPLLVQQQYDAQATAQSAQRDFDKGKGDVKELLKAYQHLLKVRLEIASTPNPRIEALEQHVINLSKIESKLKGAEKSDLERRQLGELNESEEYRTVKLAH